MKRLLFFLAALAYGILLQAQQLQQRTTLHFAVDDHRLDERALAEIDRFVATCDRTDDHEFTLMGHTDSDGHLGYNEVLARERARTVRERLIALGVDPTRISTRAFGEREPIAANTTNDDKQRNRRVELQFARLHLQNLDQLNARIGSDHVSTHLIDPTKVNELRGPQGVMVRIPANVLVDAKGNPVHGEVRVRMTEAITINDMIAEGLSTGSDGRILETGGMLRVDAVAANGATLALDSGATMLVSIPAEMEQPGMTLFTSTEGGNWSNTGTAPLDMSAWVLPERPKCNWPTYLVPVYKASHSAKPLRPSEPALPHEPQPPRRESYTSNVRWYQALAKDRIAAADQKRYDAAMEQYNERMAKYEAKRTQYEADLITWPERNANYQCALGEWVSDTTQARMEFFRAAVPKAEVQYQQRIATARAQCEQREAEWCPRYEASLAEYGRQADSLGWNRNDDLGSYVFAASQMGWINCDRFYNVPESRKYEVIVQDTDPAEKQVYLVLTDINSLLRMQRDGFGRYVQPGIPRDQQARVVAYKVEDGKAYLSDQPVRPGERPAFEFKHASVNEIRMAIEGLRGS